MDQFRSELKQRDDEEEARLERVYNGILEGKSNNSGSNPGQHTVTSFGNGIMTEVGNTKIIETYFSFFKIQSLKTIKKIQK